MSQFHLSRRSRSKLVGVHPDLIAVVELAIGLTEVDFAVTEGIRSITRQRALLRAGFSRTLHSKHLTGHAVDVMACGDLDNDGIIDHQDKNITWSREHYASIAVAMGQAADELGVNVRWGGAFKSFYDGPHFELVNPRKLAA